LIPSIIMHRFFIPSTCIEKAAVYFPMEVCRQMSTVLHLRQGEHVMALDNSGQEYEVELDIVAPRSTEGHILAAQICQGEPRTRLTLYLGLTQREKFEWMLQKCTEVGAAGFVPVVSSRSLVQSPDEARTKADRWQRIIQEAAEQSGRGRIPSLAAPLRWDEALRQVKDQAQPGVIAWEGEKSIRIPEALAACCLPPPNPKKSAALAVFIGPEGGYSEEEVVQARAAGLAAVTLGKRILRMETAAVVATALILHELDD
jgi:16S rRNA (uracil1498-N3)-methyltransferase